MQTIQWRVNLFKYQSICFFFRNQQFKSHYSLQDIINFPDIPTKPKWFCKNLHLRFNFLSTLCFKICKVKIKKRTYRPDNITRERDGLPGWPLCSKVFQLFYADDLGMSYFRMQLGIWIIWLLNYYSAWKKTNIQYFWFTCWIGYLLLIWWLMK